MKVRIRRRQDDSIIRRWFAILCGNGVGKYGHHDITRVFFPWFYVDFIFPRPTPKDAPNG